MPHSLHRNGAHRRQAEIHRDRTLGRVRRTVRTVWAAAALATMGLGVLVAAETHLHTATSSTATTSPTGAVSPSTTAGSSTSGSSTSGTTATASQPSTTTTTTPAVSTPSPVVVSGQS